MTRRMFVRDSILASAGASLAAALTSRALAVESFQSPADGSSASTERANKWKGAEPTPDWIGIDTPVPYLNDSWKVAVALLDHGRQLYRQGKSLRDDQPDQPGGFPGAWLPVSCGQRCPLVYPFDERDMRHTAKMISYLWAAEEGLFEELERNLFIEQIANNGDFLAHDGKISPYVAHVGMFMASAADLGWCYGITPRAEKKVLANVVKLVNRTREVFDPEGSGLLSVGVGKEWPSRGFWGMFLGEPNHFPANFDGRNKLVIAGMAMAVFAKRFRDVAREIGAPEAEPLAKCHDELVAAIEGRGWSERAGYYYLQRDDNSDHWFLSMNGQCEESRETDIVPFYAAEACELPERIKAVGRVLNRALLEDRVFPMPTRWPTYSWYSPSHPDGADVGEYSGMLGGAWDTPYFHCVELLARLGLQQAVQRAVFRRAEVIHRDQDCLESYYPDGTVDHTRFYNRDRYIVSATAHLASIVEGLFGVTPARTGFAEVNICPNLPFYRRHRHTQHASAWAGRDNRIRIALGLRGRLDMTLRYDEDAEILTMRTNPLGIQAHIRLPLDLGSRFKRALWNGNPVEARVEQGIDSDFVHVDHRLDGGELRIELAPHPQKNQGTTPAVVPERSTLQ